MEDLITRKEHEEFSKRIEAENHRQNKRLDILEESVAEINKMTRTIERLATNMEAMTKELEKQGDQLEELRSRDGKMWRQVIGWVLAAVIGGAITFLFTTLGL